MQDPDPSNSPNDAAPAHADAPNQADAQATPDPAGAPGTPALSGVSQQPPTQLDAPTPAIAAAAVPLFGERSLKMQLPNILTAARLVMTVAFVALLSFYEATDAGGVGLLVAGLLLFVLAAATDWLDGYLARKWRAISIFGRVMDPLADKLLILAAFILLAGPNFLIAVADDTGVHTRQLSGVLPWMASLILARELLVTSLRGVCESRGIDFSASMTGKLKMVAQSVAVPLVLLLVAIAEAQPAGSELPVTLANVNLGIGLIVTLLTAASAWPYLTRAYIGLTRE